MGWVVLAQALFGGTTGVGALAAAGTEAMLNDDWLAASDALALTALVLETLELCVVVPGALAFGVVMLCVLPFAGPLPFEAGMSGRGAPADCR
jgi:hypothetical protein